MEVKEKNKKNFFRKHKILSVLILIPILILIIFLYLYGAYRYDTYGTKTYIDKIGDGYISITPNQNIDDWMLRELFSTCEYKSHSGNITCDVVLSDYVHVSNGEEYLIADDCLLPRKIYVDGKLKTIDTNNCNDAIYQYDAFISLMHNIF